MEVKSTGVVRGSKAKTALYMILFITGIGMLVYSMSHIIYPRSATVLDFVLLLLGLLFVVIAAQPLANDET